MSRDRGDISFLCIFDFENKNNYLNIEDEINTNVKNFLKFNGFLWSEIVFRTLNVYVVIVHL